MNFSYRGAKMAKISGLRSIMKDVATTVGRSPHSDWIDLTIGNPARIPEVERMWHGLTADVLSDELDAVSFRYGQSRGNESLLAAIAAYFNERYGWHVDSDNIVVGAGSQMLSFAAAAIFTGSSANGVRRLVIPAEPDYAGFHSLSLDENYTVGIAPKIALTAGRNFRYELDLQALSVEQDVGMLLMSNPANPTGRSVSAEELGSIIDFAESRDVPLLIDHAYGLPFPQVSVEQTLPVWHPNVINCFSISKAGMPGERLGFAVGQSKHIDAIASFISNSILHASQMPQMVLKRALLSGELDRVVSTVIRPYYSKRKLDAERLLAETLPESVPWRMHASGSGMFSWIWVDHPNFDDIEFYERLRDRKTFIMPGRHFFVDQARAGSHSTHCFRLSLTGDEDLLKQGIARLSQTLAEMNLSEFPIAAREGSGRHERARKTTAI